MNSQKCEYSAYSTGKHKNCTKLMQCPYKNLPGVTLYVILIYCIRHPVRVRDNRRFLSRGIEFSKNEYADLLKAPSRNIY